MSSEVGRPIYLDRVALDFPELKIVGGTLATLTEEAVAVATKHENVYIDTGLHGEALPPGARALHEGAARAKSSLARTTR